MLKDIIIDEEILCNRIQEGNLRGERMREWDKRRDIVIYNARQELQHGG